MEQQKISAEQHAAYCEEFAVKERQRGVINMHI